jgi:hypothetical protein
MLLDEFLAHLVSSVLFRRFMPTVGDGFRKSSADRSPVFIVIDQQRYVNGVFATSFRNSDTAAAQQYLRRAGLVQAIAKRHFWVVGALQAST